jgi:alkylation response protein AidB-like acyl-CoA dehydrogenase
MVFEISAEREELRATVRRFLDAVSPESAVRADMSSADGFDPCGWPRATSELGLTALAVPEAAGGYGYGPLELGVVLEEAGRALWCAPLFSTGVLGTQALLAPGCEEAAGRWLPAVVAGGLRLTLATDASRVRATGGADDLVLTGELPAVLDGATAGLLLVPARTDRGVSLFAVESGAAGLAVARRTTVDLTRRLDTVRLDDTPGVLVGTAGSGEEVLARVLDRAAVALAVESVGVAQRLFELTLAYARERVQFGRTIGSFQAVKHALVGLHVELEQSRSVAWSAVHAWADDSDDLPLQANLAKSFCTEVAVAVTTACIQTLGGIGFTWEHPAHLYLKRAKGSSLFLGSPGAHRGRLAAHLQLTAGGGA